MLPYLIAQFKTRLPGSSRMVSLEASVISCHLDQVIKLLEDTELAMRSEPVRQVRWNMGMHVPGTDIGTSERMNRRDRMRLN